MDKETIFKSIFELVVNFTQFFNQKPIFSKMTTNEFYLFLFINFYAPVSMKYCSEKIELSKSTITVLIDKLENKNLVIRKRSKKDRRVIHIFPTNRGKKLFENFSSEFYKIIEVISSKIPNNELEIINKGFELFIKNIFGGE
ncbi:MarR family transcriptional regulator [Thermosipho melanesiensis]|uniref:HTH-type transcriptional regulator SarZ n=2 Tax=Thermosipho melanesiensis TaxID=46541 RepID=A6LP16_THEM4|nr:MarR family transcriptional regulator [Thermosipho melanesiensis]ABR31667.1 transcriptional regulator, MarR family [Thermosipho melanesiensis BI429]APT74694.1 MarR family transcriptional regulator [Thermosipho melanesiensis]OOC35191.1 MarR family transcriptional regulator [Thermosipho melanesiensis]OOC35401.1 MarR family transcriptional regulator [Thermosipho melanesiensis]OOC36652.1 MarR family transcriptional regulator [Thermosipho melanesiensis]